MDEDRAPERCCPLCNGTGTLPASQLQDETLFDADTQLDVDLQARNVVIGACCAAMVALHGSHGAMQELAVAIDREVPVVAVETYRWEGLGVQRIAVDQLGAWLNQLD